MESISCPCSLNCPPWCQWIGSSSEEMELCAQMGAHTAPPPTETTVKSYVCLYVCVCLLCVSVFMCTALSLRLHLSQSLFRFGRSSMHVPDLCACVCLCGRAQLDSDCWHWLGDSLNTRLCWRVGVPPRLPLCGEWILIIQSDLNLVCLWGYYPLPRDELILLLHERPTTGKRQTRKTVMRC